MVLLRYSSLSCMCRFYICPVTIQSTDHAKWVRNEWGGFSWVQWISYTTPLFLSIECFLHYMHESRLITCYSWNAGLTKVSKLEFRLLLQIKLSPVTLLKGLQMYEGIIYRRYRNSCHLTVYCRNYMLEDVYDEGRFKISIRKLFNRNPDNGNICPDLLLYNLLI